MKTSHLGFVAACVSLLAFPAFAGSVVEVSGSGTNETNCLMALGTGCTITGSGAATGTNIDAASFVLRVDIGSPASANGSPVATPQGACIPGSFIVRVDVGSPVSANGSPVATPQGACIPGSFIGRITTAGGDTLEFSHAGLACEETQPGSPVHYSAAYRVTGGTGVLAGARGTGTVNAAFTRETPTQPSATSFYLRGTLE